MNFECRALVCSIWTLIILGIMWNTSIHGSTCEYREITNENYMSQDQINLTTGNFSTGFYSYSNIFF